MSRRQVAPGVWVDEGRSGINAKPWSWAAGVHAGADRGSTPTAGERSLARAVGNRTIDRPEDHRKAQQRQWSATHRAKIGPEELAARRRRWKQAARERKRALRPVCGQQIQGSTASCARSPHDKGYHVSRAAMDARNRRVEAHRARKAA